MIKSITLRNFGKHKELDLELHPGLNVIVGQSAKGKSWAGPRAIRWVAKNEPLGEGMRNWDGGDTMVGLTLSDNVLVVRAKNSKDNIYMLDTSGLTEPHITFKAFGRNPPEEVLQALNLGDINFQSQHDPLYLLTMSPTEVAKVLNQLAGLDIIDEANSRINKRLWAEQQERNTAEARRSELEEELARYDGLDEMENKLAVVEELESRSKQTKVKHHALEQLVGELRVYAQEEARYAGLDEATHLWKASIYHADEGRKHRKKAEDIQLLLEEIKEARKEEAKYKTLPELQDSIARLLEACEEAKATRHRIRQINTVVGDIKLLENEEARHTEELDIVHGKFNKLMPEVCPICGAPKGWEVCHG